MSIVERADLKLPLFTATSPGNWPPPPYLQGVTLHPSFEIEGASLDGTIFFRRRTGWFHCHRNEFLQEILRHDLQSLGNLQNPGEPVRSLQGVVALAGHRAVQFCDARRVVDGRIDGNVLVAVTIADRPEETCNQVRARFI